MPTTLPTQDRPKRVMLERVHDHLLLKFSDTEKVSKAWRHVTNHRRSTMTQACNLSRQQRPQDRWQAALDYRRVINSLLRSPTQKRRKEWHTLLTIHACCQRMMSSKAITSSGPFSIRKKKITPFTSWAQSISGYQSSLWIRKSLRVKITKQAAFQIAEVLPWIEALQRTLTRKCNEQVDHRKRQAMACSTWASTIRRIRMLQETWFKRHPRQDWHQSSWIITRQVTQVSVLAVWMTILTVLRSSTRTGRSKTMSDSLSTSLRCAAKDTKLSLDLSRARSSAWRASLQRVLQLKLDLQGS